MRKHALVRRSVVPALALVAGLAGLLVPASPAAAHGDLPDGRTRQATVNVPFTIPAEQQLEDVRWMARSADVIGWQEIVERSQTDAIAGLVRFDTYWPGGFREDGLVALNPMNSNPISWRRDLWELRSSGTRLASLAIPGVCRDRYLSWVVLRHVKTGRLVARWNIHFVPGAWSPRPQTYQEERQAAWRRQARVVRRLVTELSTQYRFVVGGGDVNRLRSAFLGDLVAYDAVRGLDYLTRVPVRLMTPDAPVFHELNGDHAGVVVPYTLAHRHRRAR